jgi:hypothetical protein
VYVTKAPSSRRQFPIHIFTWIAVAPVEARLIGIKLLLAAEQLDGDSEAGG